MSEFPSDYQMDLLEAAYEVLASKVPSRDKFFGSQDDNECYDGNNMNVKKPLIEYMGTDTLDAYNGHTLTLIGAGYFRAVFIHSGLPGYVLKYEYSRYTSESAGECMAYNRATPKQRRMLPEPVAHFPTKQLLVSRRVYGETLHTIAQTQGEEGLSKVMKAKNKVTRAFSWGRESVGGITCSDLHNRNIMMTETGKVYVVDFG